jgi:hypothetical protein
MVGETLWDGPGLCSPDPRNTQRGRRRGILLLTRCGILNGGELPAISVSIGVDYDRWGASLCRCLNSDSTRGVDSRGVPNIDVCHFPLTPSIRPDTDTRTQLYF